MFCCALFNLFNISFQQDASSKAIGGGFSGGFGSDTEVPEVPQTIADVHSAPDIPPIDIEGKLY